MPGKKQDVALEIFYDGTWHNLVTSDDVLTSTPITIQRGDGEESAAPRPSSIVASLANDDDMYRTSNPESPLYGKVGLNTPVRVTVAGVARGMAEISAWVAGQSRDFRRYPRRGSAWVDIEAYGLLGRVNQWTEKVQSTMVKGLLSFGSDLVGAWPLEDESGAEVISQVAPVGAAAATFTGDVTLGDDERPAGSARSVKIASGARIRGVFSGSTASGWQISFAARLPSIPGSATYEEIFTWYDTTGRRWTWEVNNANFGWTVYTRDPAGGETAVASLASSYTGREPNQWIRFRMKTTVSGSTVTYEPAWYVEGDTSPVGTSGTFSGTSTGKLRDWTIAAATYNAGAWYTGVCGIDDAAVTFFNAGVLADFNGHAGETPGNRFVRVMGEKGLSAATNGTLSAGVPMGGQPVDTLAEILREIRDTDDAVLFESKSAINLVLTTRDARYRQIPAVTLNAADPDTSGLPALPDEVTDDLPIHNLITASNRDGSTALAQDSTSIMGTQPPPNGRGEYRQTVDVNVEDAGAALQQQAWWWLYRGTVDRPRFPQVVVNLAACDPARIAQIENVTVGSVIEIINMREYVIRLYVVGYKETIGTHSRVIVFTCAPDQQFVVGQWDAADSLWDLRTCTLSAAAEIGATTLTFAMTADESWSTTDAYDLMIAGELVGVPAGAMGARSGSGPYTQILTGAVRSKNGIRKRLPAGSAVQVDDTGRWAI